MGRITPWPHANRVHDRVRADELRPTASLLLLPQLPRRFQLAGARRSLQGFVLLGSHERTVSRNVLASDLGIIAKGNDEKMYQFAVTDLRTAETLSNVELEVYDLQHQLLSASSTDNNGFAILDLDRMPFMLVAKRGKERGYLRMDDGMALSTSMFNVGGEKLMKGVKGFLYGERGVWRPGDSLYLAFMLEDEMKALPKDHPVVFELFTPENQLYQRLVRTTSVNGVYDMRTGHHRRTHPRATGSRR